MLFIDDILNQSPSVLRYGGGQWVMYSVHCCWWTTFPEDLGSTKNFPRPKLNPEYEAALSKSSFPGLPCCPHCGSMLLQAPLLKFIAEAKKFPERYGDYGLDAFIAAHERNARECHPSWIEYNPIARRARMTNVFCRARRHSECMAPGCECECHLEKPGD